MKPGSAAAIVAVALAVLTRASDAQSPAQANRTLRGIVRDSASGETLPRATVVVEGTAIATQTNIDGRFVLIGVPAGPRIVRVTYIGYGPGRVQVSASDTIPVAVRLSRAAVELEAVRVAENAAGLDATQRVGEISVSPQQVATTPSLGELDVFRTLQLLPGVSNANQGTSALYVRGGTPDQNLVLFDGMTMYHVDHFFGIFSAFNADAIKDIRLYAGGYPAKYGGRVSSVVDLTGKEGDARQFRGSAGLNLLSARAEAQIPLGRGALFVAARRSYTDVIQSGLYNRLFGAQGGSTPPPPTTIGGGRGGRVNAQSQALQPSFYFYDLNAKLTYRPTGDDVLSLSVYRGTDNLDQSTSSQANLRGGTIGGGGPSGVQPGGISTSEITDWGNSGASGRWFRQWAGRFSSDLLVAGSRYFSNSARSSTATLGAAAGNAATLPRPGLSERNAVNDVSVRADQELTLTPRLRLDFGGRAQQSRVEYVYTQMMNDTATGGIDRPRTGTHTSGYAEAVWTPAQWIDLTAGARATSYDLTNRTYAEPRVSAAVSLTPSLRLKGAWGRYHQFVNRVENEDILNGSHDFWLLADSALKPTAAEHRIAGLTYERPSYVVSVEAYDKRLSDLALFSRRYRRVSFAADYNTLFYSGTGHARGVDVLLQKKFGAVSGWMSYSLSKVTEQFADVDDGREFAATQDQRHEVKTSTTYTLGKWTFASAFVLGSGTPYTSPESEYYLRLLDGSDVGYIHVGPKNGQRLPAYHRLDLAAFRRFRGNDRFDWEVGASLFNVYNRQNVWYRKFDLSTVPITITDVHTLGFLPTVDVRIVLK